MRTVFTKALSQLSGRVRELWQIGQRAPQERVVQSSPGLDAVRNYVADNLNFQRLKTLARAGDAGDIATSLALFEEMEAKDLHLQGVANTRRSALTGLDWEIVSASENDREDKTLGERSEGNDAAKYVDQTLHEIDFFDEALKHLATAIGPNLAVAELVWDRHRLIDVDPVPSHRLRIDTSDPRVVRVVTEKERLGVVASSPKFIVHIPESRAGFPFFRTISQAQAQVFLVKHLMVADWATFCELFGMPTRWATFDGTPSETEKDAMLEMLKDMGSAGYGLFSRGVSLDFKEPSQRSQAPFKDIVDWCERKQSIGFLGQHMTTDTSGATGTMATASVQELVRQDLLEDDVRSESRSIGRQIIAPMLAFKYPGREMPLPTFRRRFREPDNRKGELENLILGKQAGVPIPVEHAHQVSGIPKPTEGEEVLEAFEPFEQGLNEGFAGAA